VHIQSLADVLLYLQECTNGWQQRHKYAMEKFRNAGRHWTMRKEGLSFTLNLGNLTETGSIGDLAAVLRGIEQLSRIFPNYHAFGQSEAVSESKKAILARLGLEGTYYSRKLPCDWRLIVLDTNQACQPDPTSMGIMSPKEGVGIGVTQLAWLKSELEMAEDAGERVMVAAHDPLVPGSAPRENCVGDSVAVSEVLFGSKSTDVVLCSGDHAVPYYEKNCVHFLAITSMVTGPCATVIPYCIMKVEDDEILGVRGFGGHPDRTIELKLERRKTRPFQSRSFSWGESLKKALYESDEEVEMDFSKSVI